MFCTFETKYDDEDEGKYYWKEIYYYGETRIVIRKPINNPAKYHFQRFDVILSDPTLKDQDFMQFLFDTLKQEDPHEFYNIILSEFEIAYDFYPTTDTDVDEIKDFFDKHLYVKYSRSASYFTFKGTKYTGRNGNIGKAKRHQKLP